VNIGIVVHSQTGNTHSVASKLKEKLSAAGHSVALERLQVVGGYTSGMKDMRFETLPNVGQYDALVFGAPVEAFSLSPVMVSYLKQVAALPDKDVACLVTQAFPYPWLGGNRAIRQMRRFLESKGATVRGSGVVNWMKSSRDQQIVEVVDRLSGLF
jgi:menaquinone-dependent protoporphyrinogen IX oxidase